MDRLGFLHIGKTGGTAAKAVLQANNELGAGQRVACYMHDRTLADVVGGALCEQVIFFVREPVARFVSAFNSRLRKGYPRHNIPWSESEAIAFGAFKTPNDLAEALGDENLGRRKLALDAMSSINHLRRAYEYYLGSVALLEQARERIYFIGATETFGADFALLRGLLRISPSLILPTDDHGAHRTPDGFDTHISPRGRKNVQAHYAADLKLYDWCVRQRAELIALHTAPTQSR